MDLKNIPNEVKLGGLFCLWKKDDERGKIPFNPATGGYVKSNDSKTFVSYYTLIHYLDKYVLNEECGLGLGIFNDISAIDIDDCVDENGVISEMAQDIIDYCKSYTEYSPSGKGIRVLLKTPTRIDKNTHYIHNQHNGLEIYISGNTKKFVSLTGNKISGDFKEVNLQPILDKYMKKQTVGYTFDLDEALEHDQKLNTLWNTKAPGSGSNESELDMALCCKLAYYLKSNQFEIKRYFEMSPFFKSKDERHIKKWDTEYSVNTITKACGMVGDTVAQQPVSVTPTKRKYYLLNDTGNAQRFVDKYVNKIHYNVDNERWMLWNGKYWETDLKDKVRILAEVMAEEMSLEIGGMDDGDYKDEANKNLKRIYNVAGKDALLKEAQHLGNVPILNDDLDNSPFLFCCENGTLNLETGELTEFRKEDMISQVAGGLYSSEEPKVFKKFVNDIFGNNQKLIKYTQKALGYAMSDSTREQCMWIFYGDGNNGKSLLLDIVREALGSYAISCRPQILTEQRNGNSNLEEIARMKGKRFVVVEEAKSNDRLDESLIKSLTSGIGNQVARFLYGNSFEFVMKGKLFMATNYIPKINGTDKGIWRRIKIVPFNVDFSGKEDKDLKLKLMNELPQILGWLEEGYKLYLKEGLVEPKEVTTSIENTKSEFDIVKRWIDECCEVGQNSYYCSQKTLFANFNNYCKAMKELEMSSNLFSRNLSKKFRSKIIGGKTVYYGIKIKEIRAHELDRQVAFDQANVNEEEI